MKLSVLSLILPKFKMILNLFIRQYFLVFYSEINKRRIKRKRMQYKIPNRYTRFEGFKVPTLKKWIKSLKPKFKEVPDPRGKQGFHYPLAYILELYLTGCLAGYCDCSNCVEFLRKKQDIACLSKKRAYLCTR